MSKNRLRWITLVRGPIWGIHSLTLMISWTRLGADLNLSQVVLELYSMKDVVEVYFLDTNRTQFAQIHSNNGASLTNESSSMTAYWNRVTIKRGSLIFPKINEADNHTTIILRALLNSKQTRLEALSTKTMRIFVCNSSGKHGVIRLLK